MQWCKGILFALIFIAFSFLIFDTAKATINTGVGTRNITIYEKLHPGSKYTLPPLSVFNTGTEASSYEMYVSSRPHQEEMTIDPAWIKYKVKKFYLEPGKYEKVEAELSIPIFASSGDYFGYLEAKPVNMTDQYQTAGTQLAFTVQGAGLANVLAFNITEFMSSSSGYILLLSFILLPFAFLFVFKKNLFRKFGWPKYTFIIFAGFLYLSLLATIITPVKNILGTSVTTSFTLAISLCGDGTIAGDEECEDGDLNGYTCQSFGFTAGSLSCDASCYFDTSGCSNPLPTATPTITSTPGPTSTPTSTPTPTPTPSPLPGTSPTTTTVPSRITSTPTPKLITYQLSPTKAPSSEEEPASKPPPAQPVFPDQLRKYDLNSDSRIDKDQTDTALSDWTYDYQKCQTKNVLTVASLINRFRQPASYQLADLNRDGKCDLTDFSMILYYFDL